MRIAVYYPTDNPERHRVLRAFAEGAKVCGDSVTFIAQEDFTTVDADVAVVFGVGKSRVHYSRYRENIRVAYKWQGKRTVVLEKGYIHRDAFYAAGWDGLNGHADFMNSISPSDRFRALAVDIKPYRVPANGYVLLIGQVPWDASVQHLWHERWLEQIVAKIRGVTERAIKFRPHPLANNVVRRVSGAETLRGALSEALYGAAAVITHNSNTAVDALLSGVPTWAMDSGSMAWGVASTELDRIESPELAPRGNWARDLAYAQWTQDEMRSGLAWEHLRGGAFLPVCGTESAAGAPGVDGPVALAPV